MLDKNDDYVKHCGDIYALHDCADVGMDNRISFCTEPHFKQKENLVGVLTLNCVRHSIGSIDQNVLVKFTNIHPTLHLNIMKSKTYMQTSASKTALKTYCNKYIACNSQKNSKYSLSSLNHGIYVIDIVVYDGPNTNENDLHTPVQGIAENMCFIGIIFSRIEDSSKLIYACRRFFNELNIVVNIPPFVMPMYLRIKQEQNTKKPVFPDKYRKELSNDEVVFQFTEKHKLHYGSFFELSESDIEQRKKEFRDGQWVNIIYVDFSKVKVFS